MVVDVVLQILFRYVIGRSLFWTEELGRYILIWIIFLGASIAMREKKHIGIDYLVSKLKSPVNEIILKFGSLLIFFCAVVFIVYGIRISLIAMMQNTAALNIPIGYIYMAIPVSGILLILDLISER